MPSCQTIVTRLAPCLILLFASLALCGCGRLGDRADLVCLNGAESELLDPALITAQATSRIAYAVFEGLTAFNVRGIAEPGVAERWEITPDGRHYTFHLRHNAKWSNGDPVTAQDFLYSWQRTLTPETGSEYAYQLYYIQGAKAFNEGKIKDFSAVAAHAPDPYTLEVTLANPTPFFIDLCAFTALLPVHRATVEKYPDWATKPEHFVGNGPFILREWMLFDHMRLVKNPHYWDAEHVGMRSLDIMPVGKPNTAYNFYATGVADLMVDKNLAPVPLLGELKKRPDFHAAPFLGNYFVRFNVTRKPFNDARVRKAFALVVDKQYLVEHITRAGEEAAHSFVPPGAGAGYQPPPMYQRDPELARKLLAEAGYPGGQGFPVVYYLYRSDLDLDQDIAVELQSTFRRELGVTIQLARQEWTVFLDTQQRIDYDISRSTWVGDYNDPNTFMDMFLTDGGNNETGWSNKHYDELIATAGRESDPQKRFALFREAEKILVTDEVPLFPLYYYVGIQFYDGEKLGGIEANLLDEHPFKAMYWKKR
ncbi:MAG: peptide ABC transporter substrate-binding protein [Chthoniobacter sp.]|nr:peptide ABC transporter substrate-binding protein [Chthoniobacter sp.]